MVTEKEKRRLRLFGVIIVLVSIWAFFFGSGRGILAQYSYLVWGAPMLLLGAAVVIISYLLPSNETSRKENLNNTQPAKNQAHQVE
jgi:hypothetical protein